MADEPRKLQRLHLLQPRQPRLRQRPSFMRPARSPICAWEVEVAAEFSKRILPVLCRPLEGASPPPRLADLAASLDSRRLLPKPGSGNASSASRIAASAIRVDAPPSLRSVRFSMVHKPEERQRAQRPGHSALTK